MRPLLRHEIPNCEQLLHPVQLALTRIEHLPKDRGLRQHPFLRRGNEDYGEVNEGEEELGGQRLHYGFGEGGAGCSDHEDPEESGGEGVDGDAGFDYGVGS